MDKHQSRSGEDEFELPVHEKGEPLQQTSANGRSVHSLQSGKNGPFKLCTATCSAVSTIHHWFIPSEYCLLYLFPATISNRAVTASYATIQHADHFRQPAIADSRWFSANSAKATSSSKPYYSGPFFYKSTTRFYRDS